MSARDVPMYQARQLTQGGEEIGRSEDSAGGGGLSNDPRVRVSTCSARLCTTRTNTVYSWAPGFEIAFVPRGTRTRGSRAVTARACHSLSRQSISFNSAFRARSDRSGGENRPGSRGTERTKEREEEKKRIEGRRVFFASLEEKRSHLTAGKEKKEKKKRGDVNISPARASHASSSSSSPLDRNHSGDPSCSPPPSPYLLSHLTFTIVFYPCPYPHLFLFLFLCLYLCLSSLLPHFFSFLVRFPIHASLIHILISSTIVTRSSKPVNFVPKCETWKSYFHIRNLIFSRNMCIIKNKCQKNRKTDKPRGRRTFVTESSFFPDASSFFSPSIFTRTIPDFRCSREA